jgi:metallophosphoesterase (TIGR00282 family)
LCIGDVVGRAGRLALIELLPDLIIRRGIECVICNAENAAGGSGITPAIFHKLIKAGVDCITMGDHVYRKRDILPLLKESSRIVRPANLSADAVGRQWTVIKTKSGMYDVAVACILGQMYMAPADSPWATADRVLREMPPTALIRVIDFHADASSEKIAMGWHLNGRASAVFGTHTHTQTADERVLDGGTAHISDVGMTGPYEGVLGRRKDRVLSSLTTSMPTHFEVSTLDPRLSGVLVKVDPSTGKAVGIERIHLKAKPIDGGPYDSDDGISQKNH